MTKNLKDKLSASVRRAKAGQLADKTAEPTAVAATAPKAEAKRAAVQAETTGRARKPASVSPSAPAAPAKSTPSTPAQPATAVSSANPVKESSTTLFPDRIWPD